MHIIGLYLVVTYLPSLIDGFSYYIRLSTESSNAMNSPELQATWIKNIVTPVIVIIISAWLMLGSRGIARVIDNVINAPIGQVDAI